MFSPLFDVAYLAERRKSPEAKSIATKERRFLPSEWICLVMLLHHHSSYSDELCSLMNVPEKCLHAFPGKFYQDAKKVPQAFVQ